MRLVLPLTVWAFSAAVDPDYFTAGCFTLVFLLNLPGTWRLLRMLSPLPGSPASATSLWRSCQRLGISPVVHLIDEIWSGGYCSPVWCQISLCASIPSYQLLVRCLRSCSPEGSSFIHHPQFCPDPCSLVVSFSTPVAYRRS